MNQRRRSGWTFLEMLMVGSVLTLVFGGVLKFLTVQTDFWEYSTTQIDVRTDLEQAMDSMTRELRNAQRVTPGTFPSVTIPNSPGNTTITLYTPTTINTATGVVTWSTAIQYTYDSANKRLQRTQNSVTKTLATDVTAATFSDQAIDSTLLSNEVKVSLTLQRTTPHNRQVTATASTTVRLRN